MKEKRLDLIHRLERFRPVSPDRPYAHWNLDGLDLHDEDVSRTLLDHRPAPLLFNHIPLEEVERDLEAVGMLARIRERGYADLRIQIGGDTPFENRFCLLGTHTRVKGDLLLAELRTRRGELVEACPSTQAPYHLKALILEWITLQDPASPLSPEDALPGQDHPGLGVFGLAFGLVLRYVARLKVDVVVNMPEYFHNAVLYSPRFRFFMPEREGQFQAMKRDLLNRGLAFASHALSSGGVVVEPSGEPVRWHPSEQFLPLTRDITHYFSGSTWRKATEEARLQNHYRFA